MAAPTVVTVYKWLERTIFHNPASEVWNGEHYVCTPISVYVSILGVMIQGRISYYSSTSSPFYEQHSSTINCEYRPIVICLSVVVLSSSNTPQNIPNRHLQIVKEIFRLRQSHAPAFI